MWRRVVWYNYIDVSDERSASIFRVEEAKQATKKLIKLITWVTLYPEDGGNFSLRNISKLSTRKCSVPFQKIVVFIYIVYLTVSVVKIAVAVVVVVVWLEALQQHDYSCHERETLGKASFTESLKHQKSSDLQGQRNILERVKKANFCLRPAVHPSRHLVSKIHEFLLLSRA
jgi:hypothetical protein